MITQILSGFFIFSALIMIAYLIRHFLFTLTVLRLAKNQKGSSFSVVPQQYQPTVTVLVPAHNEEKVISKILHKLTEVNYPKNKLEILVIDDASTDNTGRIADEYAEKYSFIKCLHRSRAQGGRGKPAALNAGLQVTTGEIVLCFDADYLPHKDLVANLVGKFAVPNVGAVQGRPIVCNEPDTLVTRLIALERIGGYRVDQEAREALGLVPQFGGTVGGFRRSIVESLGGFDESMLTEDTDLTFQIYLAGYKVRYDGKAECYEEAVSSWRAYWRQRQRWAKGHMQVCFKYAFKVLKSKRMRLREKIDGFMLLHIYFMPLVAMVSFVTGAFLIICGSFIVYAFWFIIPLSFYSFVGNYAPFFEVGIGAYLDGRKRVQWLTPLMIFSFLYNIPICTKAAVELAVGKLIGRQNNDWVKTEHLGSNRYVEN